MKCEFEIDFEKSVNRSSIEITEKFCREICEKISLRQVSSHE